MGLPVVTSSKRMIFLLPTTVRYQEAFQERGMVWKSFHVGVVFWQTQVKTLSKTSIYWLSDIKHATCVGHRRDHDGNSHVTSRRQHPTAYLLSFCSYILSTFSKMFPEPCGAGAAQGTFLGWTSGFIFSVLWSAVSLHWLLTSKERSFAEQVSRYKH